MVTREKSALIYLVVDVTYSDARYQINGQLATYTACQES